MPTIAESLTIAVQHHLAGRLNDAERIYREVLATEPNHPYALNLLGDVTSQLGNHEAAVEFISRAIELRGDVASFHNSLARAFQAQNKLGKAVSCFRRVVELQPDRAEAHNNLGAALHERGYVEEAKAC